MVFNKVKKGQAAIEFLMTYGWMLLVVLIVGALIFSFIDFNALLPNQLDFQGNLEGHPEQSVALSEEDTAALVFDYIGTDRQTIDVSNANLTTPLGEYCSPNTLENTDTQDSATAGEEGNETVGFSNGQTGVIEYNCEDLNEGTGLIAEDILEATVTIELNNPQTNLDVPISGTLRLQVN